MVNRRVRRRFGNVRKLPSGRWQVRYRSPDGQLRSLPRTFETKRDAERTLSVVESQLIADDWTDPLIYQHATSRTRPSPTGSADSSTPTAVIPTRTTRTTTMRATTVLRALSFPGVVGREWHERRRWRFP